MKVAIIILNWNGKNDTIECLKSLQNIDYKNYEIIIVDNASSDGSVEEISKQFPSVNLICNKKNLRFAGGNNIGIKYAIENAFDSILFLNNDTIVKENFLSEFVKYFSQNENIGICGGKIFYYSEPQKIWFAGGKINWFSGLTKHVGIRKMDCDKFNQIMETDYVSGCCMLVKKSVFEKIGLLDENYFIYGEDADFSLRAKKFGFKLFYIPSSIIWHKVSISSGGNFSWFKNKNKLKSQLRFIFRYAKFYHWISIPFIFPIAVVITFLKAKFQK